MKNKIKFLIIVLLGLGTLSWSIKTTMAEDTKKLTQSPKAQFFAPDDVENLRTPMFTGVKEVKIYVEYHDGRAREERNEETIPSFLKKENIEKLLVDMYSTRFSSEKCGKALEYGLDQNYLHGCNDQPVELITSSEYSKAVAGKDNAPGILYIIFQLGFTGYHPSHFSPPFEDAIVKYYIASARPGEALFSPSFPGAFSMSQDEDVIKKLIGSYIARNIKH